MPDVDPARRWHAGPTVLADIENLSNTSEAPHTIRFSNAMRAMFQLLRQQSFPGTHARERGATIVADKAGHLSLQNVNGLASTAGSFTPNVMLKDPSRFKVVGVFHTHP